MIRLGITMGDPAGVGPEIVPRALAGLREKDVGSVVFGDSELLARRAAGQGLDPPADIRQVGCLDEDQLQVGRFSKTGGLAQGAYLRAAADALDEGEVDALVTAPIHKRALNVCGMTGPGHTEWLTERFGAGRSVMLLAGPKIKVALATRHLSLAEVPGALSTADLVETVVVANAEMKKYFFPRGPRLAIAALNPHGEVNGETGREETEIILPAIHKLQDEGLDVTGPIAGDTVFHLALVGKFDAVIAMYHDQGLAPLKTLHFAEAVNVTLGLGVVRTSPDHGVAYDIAGEYLADATSMLEACRVAIEMVKKERGG